MHGHINSGQDNMTFGIIVKHYAHHNRSFKNWDTPKGKWISSKKQYDECMAREGMIPHEQAREIAHKRELEMVKSYDGIGDKAMELIKSVKKGKNGKIRLGGKQIDGLKEVGVKLSYPDWFCPSHYKPEGGFK